MAPGIADPGRLANCRCGPLRVVLWHLVRLEQLIPGRIQLSLWAPTRDWHLAPIRAAESVCSRVVAVRVAVESSV